MPRCVFRLAYLAVPVSDLLSLMGMWRPVFMSLYRFARPKSMMYSMCWFLPEPIRKLSGLMSLCRKPC